MAGRSTGSPETRSPVSGDNRADCRGQDVQKSRSQTDTHPIRVREGRKGSGVIRRPVSLLIILARRPRP